MQKRIQAKISEEAATMAVAKKAQSIVSKINTSVVNITFDEMKKCEEQKNRMADTFYNKINILNAICSAILSGNLLLFVYFAGKSRFINEIFPVVIYGASTLIIAIVMIMLLSNMRFKKEYYEINELKYLETVSRLSTDEMVKRTSIAAIVTKNYKKNRNLEKMKTNLKNVTVMISISIVLTIISSAYMFTTKDDEKSKTQVEVISMPEMKLFYQSNEYRNDAVKGE